MARKCGYCGEVTSDKYHSCGDSVPQMIKELKGSRQMKSVEELRDRYEIDDRWRTAWTALANKRGTGRSLIQQEYIERRAATADGRIATLMDEFDQIMAHEHLKGMGI